jgi:hypothetical protein
VDFIHVPLILRVPEIFISSEDRPLAGNVAVERVWSGSDWIGGESIYLFDLNDPREVVSDQFRKAPVWGVEMENDRCFIPRLDLVEHLELNGPRRTQLWIGEPIERLYNVLGFDLAPVMERYSASQIERPFVSGIIAVPGLRKVWGCFQIYRPSNQP